MYVANSGDSVTCHSKYSSESIRRRAESVVRPRDGPSSCRKRRSSSAREGGRCCAPTALVDAREIASNASAKPVLRMAADAAAPGWSAQGFGGSQPLRTSTLIATPSEMVSVGFRTFGEGFRPADARPHRTARGTRGRRHYLETPSPDGEPNRMLEARDRSVAPMRSLSIDSARSRLTFDVRYFGILHVQGAFGDVRGEIVGLDPHALSAASITAMIPIASLDTGIRLRDWHLSSRGYLGVRRCPEATFESESIVADGRDAARVIGRLTLRVRLARGRDARARMPFRPRPTSHARPRELHDAAVGLWRRPLAASAVVGRPPIPHRRRRASRDASRSRRAGLSTDDRAERRSPPNPRVSCWTSSVSAQSDCSTPSGQVCWASSPSRHSSTRPA